MADTAFQVQYRQEFIAGFEAKQSLLRDCVTTEADVKGNQAVFLVADSGSATAVTRGVNGLIPARADNNTQYTATLQEWHDLVRKTDFNVLNSQGNQRDIMQMTSMGVLNRKVDSDIITTLDGNATIGTGNTGSTASLSMATHAKTILGNNDVPFDGRITGLITPAFEAYLLETKEFANAEYVTRKPIDSGETAWDDVPGYYRWMGVKWVVHPNLTGAGTSSEKCYMFHQDAVGHAVNFDTIESKADYDEEQAYSWARTTWHGGSKVLQVSGIVRMLHDGSAYASVSI